MTSSTKILNEMWIAGYTVSKIAEIYGVKEATMRKRIQVHRENNPAMWPRRHKGKKNKLYYRDYQCRKCELKFAVDLDFKDQEDICCPVCWESVGS
ncbi:hypothetical protein [Alteribacter populi]|uniref:hypothetical protein n=1 Tax=Alteribacter populi TaxID=2011011 RepID=UPI000BBA6177|nr:hypothetical protein [Alteribacter populi]